MTNLNLLIQPLTTEKSTAAVKQRKYVFLVQPTANKIAVKQAIHQLYKVDATRVSMTRLPAKNRLTKNNRQISKRPPLKKAIITLKKGQTIDVNKFKEKK